MLEIRLFLVLLAAIFAGIATNLAANLLEKYLNVHNRYRFLRREIKLLLFLVLAILFSLPSLFIQVDELVDSESIAKMSGEFNIAVAEFQIEDRVSDYSGISGRELATQVSRRLEAYLDTESKQSDILFEVWSPDRISIPIDTNDDRRELAVSEIARQLGAHMVVFATIAEDGDTLVLSPEIYISEEFFPGMPEVLGEHIVGNPIDLGARSDIAGQVSTNRRISTRVKALSLIIVGLSFYLDENYEQSLDLFLRVQDDLEGDNPEGKELLYLLLGNSAGKMDLLDEAYGYYQQALAINEQYARAYVGLGELYFHQALGVPPVNTPLKISLDDLDKAESEFHRAQSASDHPVTADIGPKIDFGQGRIAFVRFLVSGLPSYRDEAQELFDSLIAAYEDGNPRIQELVGQAHIYLGTLAFMSKEYETAGTEFKTATQMLKSRQLKASAFSQLGDLYLATGRLDQAIHAYEEAVLVAPEEDRPIYDEVLTQLESRTQ